MDIFVERLWRLVYAVGWVSASAEPNNDDLVLGYGAHSAHSFIILSGENSVNVFTMCNSLTN